MIQSVTTTDKYSVHFSVCTDEQRGILWLEVVTYEPDKPRQTKDFAGNEYGKAIEYYRHVQDELKVKYGK